MQARAGKIFIAFPLNIREFQDIAKLTEIISINFLVSSEIHAEILVQRNKNPLGVFIKIDTGYQTAGIHFLDIQLVNKVLTIIKSNESLIFKGFISHFGNRYHAKDKNEILDIYHFGVQVLNQLKSKFIIDYPGLIISIGDTPSCSLVEHFTGIDEIRTGNFVYYDLTQLKLGCRDEKNIAVVVACPVIDINIARNEILIYGGAVHLSKDYVDDIHNNKSFGSIVSLSENAWGKSVEGAYLKNISQEHGIVSIDTANIKNYQIGSLIGILPAHSCLTADLLADIYFME